jgi:2-keto-4-pentenoate hydratase/2-oxohepta-3-ene-1,7-dioic acid hydratase in catechol pathway
VEWSEIWVLRPGDLLYTGTPSGVGPLNVGDTVEVESETIGSFSWSIVE